MKDRRLIVLSEGIPTQRNSERSPAQTILVALGMAREQIDPVEWRAALEWLDQKTREEA